MRTRFVLFLTSVLCVTMIGLSYSNEQKIQAIIFDFGGVIGRLDHDVVCEGVAQAFHVPTHDVPPILARLKTHLYAGGDEKQFWESTAKSLGQSLPNQWLSDFRVLLASSIREIPGSLDIVKGLQNRGYQVGLLSNVRKDKAEVYQQYGYYTHFHPVLLSCDIGYVKPDPRIYTLLLGTLKLSKEECLFIDNKLENVLAARKLGIDSILFESSNQLEEELSKRRIYP